MLLFQDACIFTSQLLIFHYFWMGYRLRSRRINGEGNIELCFGIGQNATVICLELLSSTGINIGESGISSSKRPTNNHIALARQDVKPQVQKDPGTFHAKVPILKHQTKGGVLINFSEYGTSSKEGTTEAISSEAPSTKPWEHIDEVSL